MEGRLLWVQGRGKEGGEREKGQTPAQSVRGRRRRRSVQRRGSGLCVCVFGGRVGGSKMQCSDKAEPRKTLQKAQRASRVAEPFCNLIIPREKVLWRPIEKTRCEREKLAQTPACSAFALHSPRNAIKNRIAPPMSFFHLSCIFM